MRDENTAIGVATLPNWRLVKKYTSLRTRPRGFSTGGRYVVIVGSSPVARPRRGRPTLDAPPRPANVTRCTGASPIAPPLAPTPTPTPPGRHPARADGDGRARRHRCHRRGCRHVRGVVCWRAAVGCRRAVGCHRVVGTADARCVDTDGLVVPPGARERPV